MILLVASSLSLLVVYAGVKLLIQTKKEMLGNLYNSAAWFFIIAGFVTLFLAGTCAIAIVCKYGVRMMHKEYKMMGPEDHAMKEYFRENKKMMKYHHGECSGGCMMNNKCCGEMMKCCSMMDHSKSMMDHCKTDTLKNGMK